MDGRVLSCGDGAALSHESAAALWGIRPFRLAALAPRRGKAIAREALDRRTFKLTDSELERLFLPLVRAAELLDPLTQLLVAGFRTDFYWPEIGLVVETDGPPYHRAPIAEARDRERDQAYAAAGLVTLRFTHGQVRDERPRVQAVLAGVAGQLRAGHYRAAGGRPGAT